MDTGTQLGAYKVIGIIGSGGMGTVYLGEHGLLGRKAAIKTLLPELSQQPEIAERFFNEARAVSAIADAGVVQIFDFGFAEVAGVTTAYIVMELLEGETLASRMERVGALSVGESLRVTRQCAASLAAAHAREIVHRDLKPENIFLVRDVEAQGGERTKVLDFGIAKVQVETTKLRTQTGITMGTPVYMSPEQCRGAGAVDHRADIYALGCVLFQMLTGRAPFDGEGSGELISAHLRDTPPTPSTIVAGIPPHVDALVLLCLEKDPDDRYGSMDELRVAIEHSLARLSSPGELLPVQRDSGVLATSSRSQAPTTLGASAGQVDAPPARKRRAVGILGGLAVAVAASLLLGTALLGDEADAHPPAAAVGGDLAPLPPTVRTPDIELAPPIEAPPAPVLAVEPATAPASPTSVTPLSRTARPAKPARAKVAKAKPARPARSTTKKPRSAAAGAAAPAEDLYDTR